MAQGSQPREGQSLSRSVASILVEAGFGELTRSLPPFFRLFPQAGTAFQ